MLPDEKNDACQCSDNQSEEQRKSDDIVRVICANSKEHFRVSNLYRMGLSLQAVAAITGLPEKELKRFQ